MSSAGRLKKEIADLQNDKVSGVSVKTDPSNPNHLNGTINGPADTPYAGGTFHIDIVIPSEYPFVPPKMKFINKIWHPNISSQTGAICLDILKDQWSPALTIKTALLSLQALLCAPEPSDPQDAEVATMYLRNNAQFISTAKFWTETYAMDADTKGKTELHPAVKRLMDMGFPRDKSEQALLEAKWDENVAVEALLSSM
jgi:ubiquitin-conjugating enzyme (huntingtin interacting protein 2)